MISIQVLSIIMLILTGFIACIAGSVVVEGNILFYVFGSESCPHCRPMYEWLVETYGRDKVFFCELNIDECRRSFTRLIGLGIQPYIPSIVIVNSTVRAILIGNYKDKLFIDKLLKLPISEKIPVYIGSELAGYIDGSAREMIMKEILRGIYLPTTTTIQTVVDTNGRDCFRYIVYTVSLAVIDSVNPCVFLLLFALLFTVFMVSGKRFAIYSAVVFTVAVFVSYMGLGLGLYKAMYFVPKWFMPMLALVYGVLMITDVLGKTVVTKVLGRGFPECPACKLYDNIIKPRIEKVSLPIAWAGLLGFLSSFTLLPCTAGPYILFTRLIAELPLHTAVVYLLVYNIVFVLPLIVITIVGVYLIKIGSIIETLNRYEKIIRLIGAILVIALGIYMFTGY